MMGMEQIMERLMVKDFKQKNINLLKSREHLAYCTQKAEIKKMLNEIENITDNNIIMELFVEKYPYQIRWCIFMMENTKKYFTMEDLIYWCDKIISINNRKTKDNRILLKKAKLLKKYQGA